MGNMGVVHNPFARQNLRKKHLGEELKAMLRGKGELFHTGHVDELTALAEHCLKRNLPVLGINGGDGSFHAVLTAFVNVYGHRPLPRFLLLRGGTMNTVARSLGLSGTPDSVLKSWLEWEKRGKVRVVRQATLKVNNHYGFIAGTGGVTRFLDAYYQGGRTGALKAIGLIATLVPGAVFGTETVREMFRAVPMTVFHEGRDLGKQAYTAVLASTVREVGLGFSLTARCYEKPGAFHLIAADIPPLSLVPRLFALWTGKNPDHPGFLHHGPSRRVVVRSPGPLRWMMDGDMYETSEPLEFSQGPVVEIIIV